MREYLELILIKLLLTLCRGLVGGQPANSVVKRVLVAMFTAMVNIDAIRFAVGVIGNVISFGLFMSPVPTFVKIWKAKSVQDFKPDPYVVTILNCAMWSFYGMPFVSRSNVLVVTINGFGFFLEIFYTSIFFAFSTWNKRKKIIIAILVEAIFAALVIFFVLYFVHTIKARSLVVGLICIVFNVAMYFSPLTVMRQVIRTKSVKYMPFWLSIANFVNGLVWFIYALLKWDPYVAIPNGLGTLSGMVQLILYAVYYRTTKWDDDDPPRASV